MIISAPVKYMRGASGTFLNMVMISFLFICAVLAGCCTTTLDAAAELSATPEPHQYDITVNSEQLSEVADTLYIKTEEYDANDDDQDDGVLVTLEFRTIRPKTIHSSNINAPLHFEIWTKESQEGRLLLVKSFCILKWDTVINQSPQQFMIPYKHCAFNEAGYPTPYKKTQLPYLVIEADVTFKDNIKMRGFDEWSVFIDKNKTFA